MSKFYIILLISLLSSFISMAQTSNQQSLNAAGAQTIKQIPSLSPLTVLFATNEDCDLYINGQFKSIVSKNAHTYIKLSPGSYSYTARSRAAVGESIERFTVKEGQANEVFIDLLYFIDLNKQAKDNSKQIGKVENAANPNQKTIDSKQPNNTASSQSLSELQVVQALASNMLSINGGRFIMGNNKAAVVDEEEHAVTIGPVLFGKYEVTQAQWGIIMGNNPSENKGCNACPVENVSWEEVMRFIRKLNTISTHKFRLPTEAEWEFVARMGGKQEIDAAGGPEEYIKKTAWFFGNADKKTHPVGLKKSSLSGAYDLYGNVSEWCFDWYSADYYKQEGNQLDPDGPIEGKEKVYRGGSFEDYEGDRFRPSLRNKAKPDNKSKSVGFRLVMDK